MSNSIYLVHSDRYKEWVFDSNHPTQGRRFTNARELLLESASDENIEIIEISPRPASNHELLRVHTQSYIDEVLVENLSSQWDGQRPDLSELASLFVGGTLEALDLLLAGKTKLAIHFPGAKHHAQANYSSGFCIFNDFAIAADIASRDHGLNVAILDIDGHHGDGVENLTASNEKVIPFSIHQYGIFPGTGKESKACFFYNYPLEDGAGDQELLKGVDEFISTLDELERSKNWFPDLLFLTCGADGHREDPLTGLNYSVEGYVSAARRVRERFINTPILMGGAGGYLPDTRTPEIWSCVAINLNYSFQHVQS